MDKLIYLDNSATTKMCPEAVEAVNAAMKDFGNPSSLHGVGVEARRAVEKAREQVGQAFGLRMGATVGQVIFTSGGTEANNTAILGSVYAKARRISNRIVTTDCEHPSVAQAMARLEADGFTIVRIPTRKGVLDMERAKEALSEPAQLVSMMLVNNETGAWFDVAQVFAMAKARCSETVTHCDAVQGFLKVPFTPSALHADLVSVSSHKVHGPMGMGALYISSDVIKTRSITPYLNGGGQEKGFRSGTENVMGICGFGAAVVAERANMSHSAAHMNDVRLYAIDRMRELGLQVNLPEGKAAPHIVNVTLPRIKSETMLHFLWGKGVCVSSGSACSSHAKNPSAALLAFGLSAAEADCSVRISLCRDNTKEQIDVLADGLKEGLDTLVRIRT